MYEGLKSSGAMTERFSVRSVSLSEEEELYELVGVPTATY